MSAQINEHNVAEDAHANRFANYLPLSGGTITGNLVIGNEKNVADLSWNTISFSKASDAVFMVTSDRNSGIISIGIDGDILEITNNGILLSSTNV